MKPRRPCLGLPGQFCAQFTRNDGGRCDRCEQINQRIRNQKRTQYAGQWQALSRQARQTTPWCHCDLDGHGHDGRICNQLDDLTLDHQFGRVECRSCNSAHRRNH